MKTSSHYFRKFVSAFTLIELLVVIAIIGILAAMLFPALGKVKEKTMIKQALIDMNKLGMAIKSYESDYNGRFPAPGIPTGEQDVTYGFIAPLPANHLAVSNNANVVAVLLNLETFANGVATTNKGKVFNPRGLVSLNAENAKDANARGVGPDGEYRDPWGNPYVISMDTSLNDHVRDVIYSRVAVSWDTTSSKILNGLSTNSAAATDPYGLRGQYLIWSRGPDGQASHTVRANQGVNKDNILGWQQ
ncbi:MAG: type II secretion system protein [Verrucomicrobiota bacterium]